MKEKWLKIQMRGKNVIMGGCGSHLKNNSYSKLQNVNLYFCCCTLTIFVSVLVVFFQERGHDYYNGMTKEQFKKMQEFIAGRSSKSPSSKL